MMDRHKSGIYFAILTCFFWCIVPLIVKTAVATVSVSLLVWGRFTVAGLLFLAVSIFRHGKSFSVDKRTFLVGVMAGCFLVVNSFCYTSGLHLTGAANAQVLVQMSIPFSLFVGILLFRERPTAWHYFGFIVAFFGFYYFYYLQTKGYSSLGVLEQGSLLILVAAATLTGYAGIHRAFSDHSHSEVLNVLVFFTGSVLIFPFVDLAELRGLSMEELSLIVTLGTLMLLGYGSFAEAVRRAPLTQASVIISLNPLLMLVLMYILAEIGMWQSAVEVLSFEGYVAAALAVIGVIMISSKRVPIVSRDG